jgi:predicted TIM-barrel fold metal-dependent hydrolase
MQPVGFASAIHVSRNMSPGILARPLGGMEDEEGDGVDSTLPPVVDAHVHLFPSPVFEAIWQWFDAYAWPVRYRLSAPRVVEFLRERNVRRIVGLHYAHKPGMARSLNAFMAEMCRIYPEVTGVATVLPGEDDAIAILDEAIALGLRGVKLHCHVQCFAPDATEVAPIYGYCASRNLPLVMHAGREPKSPGLLCDPYELCSVARVEAVLREHTKLKLCIPHLGCADYASYARLLERYDNLWLDTAMVLADYLPDDMTAPAIVRHMATVRPDRIVYGTDFPNLPYAWDRELRKLVRLGLNEGALAAILGGNADELYPAS